MLYSGTDPESLITEYSLAGLIVKRLVYKEGGMPLSRSALRKQVVPYRGTSLIRKRPHP